MKNQRGSWETDALTIAIIVLFIVCFLGMMSISFHYNTDIRIHYFTDLTDKEYCSIVDLDQLEGVSVEEVDEDIYNDHIIYKVKFRTHHDKGSFFKSELNDIGVKYYPHRDNAEYALHCVEEEK